MSSFTITKSPIEMAKVMRKQRDTRRKNALMDMSMEPAAMHNFMLEHNRRSAAGGSYFENRHGYVHPYIEEYIKARAPPPRPPSVPGEVNIRTPVFHRSGGSWLTPSTWGKDIAHEFSEPTSVFRRQWMPVLGTLAATAATAALAANERDRLNDQRAAREDSYNGNRNTPYKDYPPYSDEPDYYDEETWKNPNNNWTPGSWQDQKQREYDNARFDEFPDYVPDLITFPGALPAPPPDVMGMYGMGKAPKAAKAPKKSAKAAAKPKSAKKGKGKGKSKK